MQPNRTILCVDDDPDDRYLLRAAVESVAPHFRVVEAQDGREALRVLQQAKQTSDLPCMVVLDINMPLLDGRQTLETMQLDAELTLLPVVVFTSSENPRDKSFFNQRGVELVIKPFDYRQFEPTVHRFIHRCFPNSLT